MKNLYLTSIAAAVISVTAGYANADFLEDSKLDLSTRTVYFGWDEDGDDGDWHDVAQGLQVNFKSGYAFDMLGFDTSFYGAVPISTDGIDPYSNGSERGQVLGKDKNGYASLGQAYAKMKLGTDYLGAYSQVGLMRARNGGMLGTSSRSTPSSYQGGLVEFNLFEVLKLHGGYYNGLKQRTQESVDDYWTATKESIDHVWQVGYEINIGGLEGEMFYIESDEYVKQFQGLASYNFQINEDLHFKVGAYGGLFKGNGDKWDSFGGGDAEYDSEAFHGAVTFEVGYKGFTGRVKQGYTTADATESVSDDGTITRYVAAMDDRISANDYGSSITPITYLGGNFWYDEQAVTQLEFEYDFTHVGMDGLYGLVGYIYGGGINDQSGTLTDEGFYKNTNRLRSETEYFVEVGYKFPETSKLNGLSVTLMNSFSKAEYQQKTTHLNHYRWYIDYDIAVF
ncbi:hypothetical protein AB832_08220 [Flavobacteriaceae bacterium (ex Bugula neritina AB1)]|nr:hypothetical protein AB832_08220 [Flavobacteriaceae bacterium (ex Bugula neritina AB1)]